MLSSTAVSASARRKQAIKVSKAPPSIGTILEEGLLEHSRRKDTASLFIRQVGSTRRVFLLKPYMSPAEVEGMAYRIRTLTKNDSISSILVATDDTDDAKNGALPSIVIDRDDPFRVPYGTDAGFSIGPNQTWLVSGGYEPLKLFKTGEHRDAKVVAKLMDSVSDLALAMRGDERETKIPTISMPHGLIHDGECSAGFLEGALGVSYSKWVQDVRQLENFHRFFSGLDTENLDALLGDVAQIGPGGHFLGTAHTRKSNLFISSFNGGSSQMRSPPVPFSRQKFTSAV